jgi:hypothetical protein
MENPSIIIDWENSGKTAENSNIGFAKIDCCGGNIIDVCR